MRRAKFMWRVLAVTAAIALSASLADAGGAGGSGGVLPHMKCYVILKGNTPGHVVDLTDPQFEGAPDVQFEDQRVTVGKARLFCRPVDKQVVADLSPPVLADPQLSFADNYTCYDMLPFFSEDPNADVTLTNQLGVDDVKVRWSAFLCVPTLKDP